MAKRGEGFGRAASGIEKKENVSKAEADAILAASTRKSSAAAKRKNPNLKKIKGKPKKKD